MKELYYTIRYLAHRKWDSLMKIITLTSGLCIGMVLIAKISFDLSYDRWIPEAENLYQVQSLLTHQQGSGDATTYDYGNTLQPIAPAAAVEIPGVQAGTSFHKIGERVVFLDGERFEVNAVYGDTALFSTLKLHILAGDEKSLGVKRNVFLSESLAQAMFGTDSPAGRIIFTDKAMRERWTVSGIFKDIPANSHLKFNIVFSPMDEVPWEYNWNSADGFSGYVRLSPGADPQAVNKAIQEMLHRHMDLKTQEELGYSFSAYIKPVTKLHTSDSDTRNTMIVLGIFAVLLLVTVSLNYVLTTISSLASRAKSIAIRKCMGASSTDVFISILLEAVILIIVSIALSTVLLSAGKNIIEELTGVPFRNLFQVRQIIGYIAASLVVTAIAGLIPARIFSSVPAMDIFRLGDHRKNAWKHTLLFIQIACSAFITGFLGISVSQYRHLLDKDLGYNAEKLAYCLLDNVDYSDRAVIKNELLKYPDIAEVAFSDNIPTRKFYGFQLVDPTTNEVVSTCRYIFTDPDFPETIGLRLKEGAGMPEEMSDPAPALVNEMFLKSLRINDNPVGVSLPQNGMTICGVFEDFIMGSIFLEQTPVCLLPLPEEFHRLYVTVRFSEISPQVLSDTERLMRQLSPENDIILRTYMSDIQESYSETEKFRNSVSAVSVFMFITTLAGLVGFVSDEMRRKRKETAIRKINGATVADIEAFMLKSIAKISIVGIALGLICAFIAGIHWLQHFPEKAAPGMIFYLAVGLMLLCIIFCCVAISTLKAALENPVKVLKAE